VNEQRNLREKPVLEVVAEAHVADVSGYTDYTHVDRSVLEPPQADGREHAGQQRRPAQPDCRLVEHEPHLCDWWTRHDRRRVRRGRADRKIDSRESQRHQTLRDE